MTMTDNRLHTQPGGDAHAFASQNARLLCCPAVYLDTFADAGSAIAYMAARGLTVAPPARGEPAVMVAVEPMAGIEAPIFILDHSGDSITLWLGVGELLADTEGEALDKLRARFRGVLPYGIFGVLGREGRTLQ